MSKRIGISLLLAFTMLVSTLNFGNGSTSVTVYAAPACPSLTECINAAAEARDNIAAIVSQEKELSDEIAELNGEITVLRSEIESLDLSIRGTQTQISELQNEINDNRELLEETEEGIEDLMDVVAERMTITQRMDNMNMTIALLSESHDLNDFMSQVRFFSRVANTDADVMDQLADLLDLYDGLIVELHDQVEEHEEIQKNLETEQASLESRQETLGHLEADLREELYDLGIERVTEEEALDVAEAIRKVLESTPPPPVVTSSSAPNSSSDSISSSSSSSPSPSQDVGTNSGLSHPMPAGRGNITSEFGPRSIDGFHWGIDWAAHGTPPILAAASGLVTVNTWHDLLGWYVIISHDINGQRVDTLYAHLKSQSSASVDTIVTQGETIGIQGNTGFSSGPHLHFEVHPGGYGVNTAVNPRGWISNP